MIRRPDPEMALTSQCKSAWNIRPTLIKGQTNVRSSRFGAGAIDGVGKELGRFIVTPMDLGEYNSVAPRLLSTPSHQPFRRPRSILHSCFPLAFRTRRCILFPTPSN